MPQFFDRMKFFNTPAELDARMSKAMIGYDVTNDRLGVKRLKDGQMVYFDNTTGITPNEFFGYTASGGQGVDADGEDLPIVTEVREDSAFSHSAGSAEVEIQEEGYYEIIAESSFNLHEDNIVELAIYHDDGTGYALMPGAIANCGV